MRPILHIEAFNRITSETRLVYVDVNLATSKMPREVDTEKPFNDSHEVNHQNAREDALDFLFNNITCREEDKVVHVEAESEGHQRWCLTDDLDPG